MAVHSLKDVPTHLPGGLTLAAISERAAPEDAVVLSKASIEAGYKSLSDLPKGSLIGTSSLRREALLRRRYPDLDVAPVRGNLNTRIKKLDGEHEPAPGAAPAPVYAALVLAKAGLERLGWGKRISQVLDPTEFPYGVSQGALGIEVRGADLASAAVCRRACEHPESAARCQAERAFLRGLQGGCQVPIGVLSELTALGSSGDGAGSESGERESAGGAGSKPTHRLALHGTVLSRDGQKVVEGAVSGLVALPASGETPAAGECPQPAPGKGGEAGASGASVPQATHELHFGAAPRYWHEAAAVGVELAKLMLEKGAGDLLVHVGVGAVAGDGAPEPAAAAGAPAGLGRPITYGAAEGDAEAAVGASKPVS